MKKFITSIILISALFISFIPCIPIQKAYALDLLYEDFESELNTSKWTTDFRSGPTAGIITLEDGNSVMHTEGTFTPRSEANIAAGKDYRHAMLRAAALSIGQASPFKITFDVNIFDLGEGSHFYLYFTSGSKRHIFLDFNSDCELKVGHYSRLLCGFEKNKWYSVEVYYNADLAKPFTVTLTSRDDASVVGSLSFKLDRIFNASILAQFQANGVDIIDFTASGVGAEDNEARVGVYYDNIRVEKISEAMENILFFDNFEGYGVKHFITVGGDSWTGDSFFSQSSWAPDTRNFLILEEDEDVGGTVLRLGVSPGTEDIRDNGYIYKTVDMAESVNIHFSFKYEQALGIKRVGVMTGNQYNLMTVENNYIYDYNGNILREVLPDVWYDCVILLSSDGYHDIYINDAKITESSVQLPSDAQIGSSVSVYFGVHGINETNPVHVNALLLDDVLICGGNETLTKEEIKRLPTVKRYEHENQPNPLTDLEETRAAIKERTKNLIVYAVDNSKSLVMGEIKEAPVALWENNIYLIPAVYTAEAFGGKVTAAGTGALAEGTWGSILINNDGSITAGGSRANIYTEVRGGIVYAQADTFAPLIGKVFSSTIRHIAVISSEEEAFTKDDAEMGEEILRDLLYPSPKVEEVTREFNETNAQHPRIIATNEDFARVRELMKTDDLMKKWAASFLKKADRYINEPHIKYYYENNQQLLAEARGAEKRLPALALAYHMTLDTKYSDRAIDELMTMVNLPGWDVQDTLSCATVSYIAAVCYDWLYDLLTEAQRAAVEKAIYNFFLQPTLEGYRDPTLVWNLASHWVNVPSNWTAVCNGGAIMSALAIFDKYPKDCAEIIASAYRSLSCYLKDYFPDGGSFEGLGYWAFAMRILTPALASSVISLGTDFDYPEAPGLREANEFPIALHGINAFGFHDSRNTPIDTQIPMYWSRRLNNPSWGKMRAKSIEKGTFSPMYYDILWYSPEFKDYSNANMPLDRNFRYIETGSLRSTWADDGGALVFFHGGPAHVSHSQMDAGSLEMEMLGERWIWDLGTDDLTYTTGAVNNRYDVYRLRAEGNNALVINPSLDGGQERDCYAYVEDMVSKPKGSYAVMNLTDCYRKFADSYKRGYMLADDRKSIVIQDEVHAKEPSEFFWSFNTKAQIDMAADGKSAVLTMNSKKLKVTLESDVDGAVMDVMPCVPLPTSPQVDNAENTDFRKLFIDMKEKSDAAIKLTFSPLGADGSAFAEPIVPMAQWSIPDGELERGKLKSLKISGNVFSELTDTRFDYIIPVAPGEQNSTVFTYTLQEGCTAEDMITENSYVIQVTDPEGEVQTYTFNFVMKDAEEALLAQLEIEDSTSPNYGDFTLIGGNVSVDTESFENEKVLKVESTDSTATFKTGLLSPEYRSVYDVTFYIPASSAENVNFSTKLYFRTDVESETDAEAESMTFGNGILSYSESSAASIANFADKWITIRQEFTGSYEKISVLDENGDLFTSDSVLIAPDLGGGTRVRKNTITSVGMEITGHGTIYLKKAFFNKKYYKKNLLFEHEFLFGEQYSDRSLENEGETGLSANSIYTKGFFSHTGKGSGPSAALYNDAERGNVYQLTAGTATGHVLKYGFFPVDLKATANKASFGALISTMPDYTSGYEIFEMDIKIPQILDSKISGTSPLYITSGGNLAKGDIVGDMSSNAQLLSFADNQAYIDGISEEYPVGEWFKLRIVLDLNGKTYKVQMIKDAYGTTALFESEANALPEELAGGLNQTALVYSRLTTASKIYIDDIYCCYVTNEQLSESSGMSVSISGTPEIGKTLTANVENAPEGQLSYQWYQTTSKYAYSSPSPTAISGATSSTYTLQEEDREMFITVRVTAEDVLGFPIETVASDISAGMFVGVLPISDDFEAAAYSGAQWTEEGKQVHKGSTTVYLKNADRASAVILGGRSGNGLKMYINKAETGNTDEAYLWTQRRFFWGNLNKDIVSYSVDLKIESGLTSDFTIWANTEYRSLAFVSFNEGKIKILGAESSVSYPEDEWFTLNLILYPETGKFDVNMITADAAEIELAHNEDVGNTKFSNDLKATGLRNVLMRLDSGADSSKEGAVIIDNIVTDLLKESKAPVINISENETSAYVELFEDEPELSLTLFLALYNADGSLYNVYSSNTAVEGVLSCTAATAVPEGGEAKVFLWNEELRAMR